ncbi:LemA family protein [Salicibibacter kimchii]|uniref:LemA family protein n=1 Tax=Salicibibacter kimchii TaxID=2099786 RepID=UPI00135A75D8|nr:LemA family protein [Salicibibacter kimchii]
MGFAIILGIVIVATLLIWVVGYSVLLKFVTRMETRWQRIMHLLSRVERSTNDFLATLDQYGKLPAGTTESLEKVMEDMQDPANERGDQLHAFGILNDRITFLFEQIDADEDLNDPELVEISEDLNTTLTLLETASQSYNYAVEKYNKSLTVIPTKYVANVHQFKPQLMLDETVHRLSSSDHAI